ncbi:MAG: hypothetical protein ABW221_09240 [Vicinamibacteria bacterium]
MTVLAGLGAATAGLGVQAEAYFGRDRFSAFGGAGYSPSFDEDGTVYARGAGVSGGLRAYTPGRVHRGYLEVAYGPLAAEGAPEGFPRDELALAYGPAAQAGWRMTRPGGFTLSLSVGVGHVSDTDLAEGDTDVVAFIGLGKTWRRK